MMALKLVPLFQIILIFFTTGSLSYPNAIYGTKRYGRSASSRLSSYDTYPHQTPMLRTQRYPINYYKLYPYSQAYPEDYYYPQDTYPVYYPAPRTSKYEVYQAVLPYYYQERPLARPYSYYGYADPMVDVQEDMVQEAEREEREEAQPIGHESYYENENSGNEDEALDEVNAAFLQNLILSQMYQDSVDNEKNAYDPYAYNDYDGTYGKFEEFNDKLPSYKSEDEDVRELKQLTRQQNRKQFKNPINTDEIHWFKNNKNYNRNENKRSNNVPQTYPGLFTDRKPIIKPVTTSTTTELPSTTEETKKQPKGQKEEFQMRPATPVRNPFSHSVLNMLSRNDKDKKRTPSVYDTIKHMLDVEKSLENSQKESDVRPSMKKRIITPEESLTRQLSVLKKSQ